MSRITPVLLVIIFLSLAIDCLGQKEPSISNPTIELRDQKLIITFNILESSESDRFHVRMEVTDSAGNQLNVQALEGDFGINVSGGENKRIYWDFNTDGIYIDADIYIQIYADRIPTPDNNEVKEVGKKTGTYSRGGVILQSIAFPGWGLSRVKGGPHWLKGVAGYGCIATSIAFNRMAIATYDDYKNSGSAEDASNLLNKSVQQDNISKAMAYSAIGIWVVDVVWTLAGTKNLKRNPSASTKGVSIGTNYDSLTKSPMLAFRYQF